MKSHSKYETLRERIRGPVFSIITPFTRDEDINFPALSAYLERLYRAHARIFYVMAYNSRYGQLSDDEIMELNAFVVKEVKKRDPEAICIVGDPLHCSTKKSVEFAQHAQSAGADLISIIFREKYYGDDQVIEHFSHVGENTDIGILIHEMPFLSGRGDGLYPWTIDLLEKLTVIPNIVAVKEDSKDDNLTRSLAERLGDRLAIIVSGGGKRQWLRLGHHGLSGWLNGIGVFAPEIPIIFYQAQKKGDSGTLDRIIIEIEKPFFDLCVAKYGWHQAAKAAIEARGFFSRKERLPMRQLADSEFQEVKRVIDSLPLKELCPSRDQD